MRKSLIGIILLVTIMSLGVPLISCNSDSDSTTTTNDNNCAILNVVMGGLKRKITTKSALTGNDTVYYTSVSGSLYAMYIDQYKNEIYNPDSLPVGTFVNKVVLSSVTSDGIVAYRTLWATDTLFSSTDSMDFTTPRTFYCYAYSGTAKKTYTVHVNVHQVDPEVFEWNQTGTQVAALQNITAQKVVAKDGKIYVFALAGGQSEVLTSSQNDGGRWTVTALGLTNFKPDDVQLMNNTFYALSDGKVVSSTDGTTWTETASTLSPDALVATSTHYLFALKDNALYGSADNGVTWTADSLNSNATQLPSSGFSSVCLPMSFNSNFEYVLLAGSNADGNKEWKKTLDTVGNSTEAWTLYNGDNTVNYPFPSFNGIKMLKYDDKIYAMGIQGDTLSLFHLSNDAGRTWISQSGYYVHPYNMKATNFSFTVDENNYIWIVCGGSGNVWRGRLNRLGFAKNQTIFTK